MSITAVILGIINVAIVVAILLLVGAIIVWFMSALSWPVPELVQRIYLGVVALIALYMIVAILLGLPFKGFISLT
jgi:hypothetical protein